MVGRAKVLSYRGQVLGGLLLAKLCTPLSPFFNFLREVYVARW